jgi:hypothetical protein
MARYFGGRRHVGKPRGRWDNIVWKYTVGFFQIRNWKLATRMGEGCRKKIGEATSRELPKNHRKRRKRRIRSCSCNPRKK